MSEQSYWNYLFRTADPWNYLSDYEQTKYRHTLELMPDGEVEHALELGCAEGIFTHMLAPLVKKLTAADISAVALERARQRCAGFANVSFAEHDMARGLPGNGYDLVVCSELLYYLRNASALHDFVHSVWEGLRPGGHVLTAHVNMVSDDRTETGFDFNEIGAKFIGAAFAAHPGFDFSRELRTDLYRVQLFQRRASLRTGLAGDMAPRETVERQRAAILHPSIKWGGCVMTAAEARHCWRTKNVPILMYHRVTDDGPPSLAPYRVSPEMFERQLSWLQRHGWHGMSLKDYHERKFNKGLDVFPGKPVVLTFDDAYKDFGSTAWPLLRKYGFGASLFVPVDFVGDHAQWDSGHGPPAPIMDWEEIGALSKEGVHIGSHGCCHRRLDEMTAEDCLADATRSRRILGERLGLDVTAYCYPYAAANVRSRQLIAEAGFSLAVCGVGGNPPDFGNPLYMPRIEILGTDGIDDFAQKLPQPVPADDGSVARYFTLRKNRDRATYMNS